ncbi:dioxygenase [Mitsuaria sp. WAJ17]|uniref:dioxygenase family protein n=1 Tax=Mitsuaria sp. WAJ17 TaxID=2761452 RepID=UPI0015FF223C|nr:class III extradiol ring-cleavage dioxygenase [Mitsuaria sp. WAJ17]MBB2486558.1 dioxygenase [Mitsuaria sp. WAJ17]
MTTATAIAPLFLSHGSPMTALEPGAAGLFMQALGRLLLKTAEARPQAILALSAHSLAQHPTLFVAQRQHAVHDFAGFDPALYQLHYDAPGAPGLAAELQASLPALLQAQAMAGLDHGIWAPLRYMVPQADVPVLPLGFSPRASPAHLWALGRALAPWAERGVQILASGSITHNLRRVFQGGSAVDAPEIAESKAFRHWWAMQAAASNWPALLDYRRQAPHAIDMHPTDEHLLPWFVAAGAGGPAAPALRIHESVTYGCLGMDAYAFGPQAPALAEALSITRQVR